MRGEPIAKPQIAVPFLHLDALFEHYGRHSPDAVAILAPDRSALSYRALRQQLGYVGGALRAIGLDRSDRVAVALPNGPEMAVSVLGVAASATCLPTNPAYGAEELDRYFAHLRPGALITQADSPARRLAHSRGIRVLELSTTADMQAGVFTLSSDHATLTSDAASPPSREAVDPSHVALLMTTSGTTSRPKIVPSTHANICTAACSWRATLALTETDRCLNVMPLFHGHGLIGVVLASLAAGASVVCTPGCDIDHFFGWLTQFRPTWYSAVPTMHQAILAEARRRSERPENHRLRFVRSGSARMPADVFAELERTFATCVIEFCGITETAASPVACNPLPPRPRKVGSIGVPVELDVAIMDEGGTSLPRGQTGEVVVRGASLMSGYDADPIATKSAFADEWFKTGDLGFFDDDGYLFLAGRLKEVINRGGQKIAPIQVDEVLLEHPAVAEAATFAVPHPTLGEDVAAAVVLRPRAKATAKDVRQFAIRRLAAFKVPRQVHIVADIPKGPTGKLQRVGLAAKLRLAGGVEGSPAHVPPRTALQKTLAEVWSDTLHREKIGIHDDFFLLGGDSLMAAQLLTRIHEKLHLEIDISRFFDGPTVADIARYVERSSDAGQTSRAASSIVRAPRPNGSAVASVAQQHLWELHQALPNLPFFNILHVLRTASPLKFELLEHSINESVRRHEILRTTFAVHRGQCVQIIAPKLKIPLAFHDLENLSRSKRGALAHKLLQQEALHTFDLANGPLIRARLLRLDSRDHLLLISAHQAICDGWSLGVLVEELVTIYESFSVKKESPLSPLPIQFADFAHRQRAWRSVPEMRAQLAYWQEQLADPLPSMRLSVSRAKRPIDELRTERRAWALPATLAEAAKRFSSQEGATLFMTLVAALKMMLHHYLGQDDVRVATHVANRSHPQTEGLIGPLVNTVILRTNLADAADAHEVMRRVRTTCLAAFANADLPIECLEKRRRKKHGSKPKALANVMILLQNAALRPSGGINRILSFEEANADMLMPVVTLTTYDIILMLGEGRDGLRGTCTYKPHLFSSRTIDCLLRDFEAVLESIVTRPAQPISAFRVSLNKRRTRQQLGA